MVTDGRGAAWSKGDVAWGARDAMARAESDRPVEADSAVSHAAELALPTPAVMTPAGQTPVRQEGSRRLPGVLARPTARGNTSLRRPEGSRGFPTAVRSRLPHAHCWAVSAITSCLVSSRFIWRGALESALGPETWRRLTPEKRDTNVLQAVSALSRSGWQGGRRPTGWAPTHEDQPRYGRCVQHSPLTPAHNRSGASRPHSMISRICTR
jgi:hypothetical protein